MKKAIILIIMMVTGITASLNAADTIIIDRVKPNKILYLYNEPASAEISITNQSAATHKGILTVMEEWDLEQSRKIWSAPLEMSPGERKTVTVEWKTTPPMYGRALRAIFAEGGKVVAQRLEFYQVADPKEWLRCFLIFFGGIDKKETPIGAELPFNTYDNYDNHFSYMLSGFSHLAPEEDEWIGGQNQYHIVKKDFIKNIQERKQMGIRAGAYTIGATGGPAGYEFARQHPEWFLRDKKGAFYIPYAYGVSPIELARTTKEPLSAWYALVPDFGNPEVVQYAGEEIVRAIKMLGFDAFFFDGLYGLHLEGNISDTYTWNGAPARRAEGVDKLSAQCVKKVREIIRKSYPDVALWYNGSIPRSDSPLNEAMTASLQDPNGGTLTECQGGQIANPTFFGHYWRTYYEMYLANRDRLFNAPGIDDPVFSGGYMYNLDPYPTLMTKEEFATTRDTWTTASHIGAIFTAGRVHPCWLGSWGFRPYTQFMTRYSALLWSRDVKLLKQPRKKVKVDSNREVWWEECVYVRENKDYRETMIHIVNSPDKEEIDFKVAKDPEQVKHVEVEVKIDTDPKKVRVWALQPYGYASSAKEPVTTELTPRIDGKTVIAELPPFHYYTLVVIQEKKE